MEGVGPMFGAIAFVLPGADPVLGSTTPRQTVLTNRSGLYFEGIADAFPGGGGDPLVRTRAPAIDGFGGGIETSSGLLIGGGVAANGRVVSPVGDLLRRGLSQALVKTALGLDPSDMGSSFRLIVDRDLANFDASTALGGGPDSADAGRIAAANLRLIMLAEAVDVLGFGAGATTGPIRHLANNSFEPIVRFLQANPNARLFRGDTERLLRAVAPAPIPGVREPYRDDVLAAYAQLIDRFALAVGTDMFSADQRARWLLGIRGSLTYRLIELRTRNSAEAAAAANAVNAVTFEVESAGIAVNRLPLPTAGRFFPQPDFIVAAPGTSFEILDVVPGASSHLGRSYAENDVGMTTNGLASVQQTLTSVEVPAVHMARLNATRNNQTINVTLSSDARGLLWFDYSALRVEGNETAQARIYLIVR
jgi:hypothetical protein